MDNIDTTNRQLVAVQGDHVLILNPPTKMTKEEALVFAAWIVCLADTTDVFGLIMEQVQNS